MRTSIMTHAWIQKFFSKRVQLLTRRGPSTFFKTYTLCNQGGPESVCNYVISNPNEPHFYKVKQGITRIGIISSFFVLEHRSVGTE